MSFEKQIQTFREKLAEPCLASFHSLLSLLDEIKQEEQFDIAFSYVQEHIEEWKPTFRLPPRFFGRPTVRNQKLQQLFTSFSDKLGFYQFDDCLEHLQNGTFYCHLSLYIHQQQLAYIHSISTGFDKDEYHPDESSLSDTSWMIEIGSVDFQHPHTVSFSPVLRKFIKKGQTEEQSRRHPSSYQLDFGGAWVQQFLERTKEFEEEVEPDGVCEQTVSFVSLEELQTKQDEVECWLDFEEEKIYAEALYEEYEKSHSK